MKKLKMTAVTLTLEEGCNKYLEYCRQKNLREGTIGHYIITKKLAFANAEREVFAEMLRIVGAWAVGGRYKISKT